MVLAAITQCETRRRVVLASFRERYEKLIADHPDAKKEMDLVRNSAVQIRQLVKKSPKVNGNNTKREQLADRHTLCKFLDGQALITGLFHTYAATYIQENEGQPSTEQQEIGT
jgi:hypothetical protein